MQEISIYLADDSELAEFEAMNKGYRVDVYAKIDNNLFNLRVFDIVRLQQEFEDDYNDYGYFAIEPNVIIVKQVNRREIKFTIEELNKRKYFNEIKHILNVNISELKKI